MFAPMITLFASPLAPIAAPPADRAPPRRRLSLLIAIALTALLGCAWTLRDWPLVATLWLPDNDDMARLSQVRDWIAGQRFNDLTQHRFGLAGGSMHWSRAADIGIALPVLLLTPVFGQHWAEVVAVIAYPAALFCLYLLLIARIAARLGGERARIPALLLAAVAFPTISLFVPGRIDHHGLQIVLMLALLDMVVAPPSLRCGLVAGVTAAISLSIGLEVAPEVLAAVAVAGVAWLAGGRDEDRRLLGFAAALGGTTLALLASARPEIWPEAWCDGFTPASSRATLVLAGGMGLLALAGRRLADWKARLALGAGVGAVAAGLAWWAAPVCLRGPYGALDPFLQQMWMRNVNEANSLWRQDTFGTPIAYAGLIFTGTLLALARARRDPHWIGLALYLLLGAVATMLQIRVAYIMAGVAVIPFAVTLVSAVSLGWRLALWVFGAGISWALIATQLDSAMAGPIRAAKVARERCVSPEGVAVVAREPAGRIVTPLSLSAYVMTATHHQVVSSLYHRNNSGNMLMYRFFLAPPERARRQAAASGITLVALCDDDLREDGIERYRRGSLVEQLQSGKTPIWLQPVPTSSAIRLYRVL